MSEQKSGYGLDRLDPRYPHNSATVLPECAVCMSVGIDFSETCNGNPCPHWARRHDRQIRDAGNVLVEQLGIYRFPTTIWDGMDDYDGISAQVHVLCEEAGECSAALRKEGPERLAEEAWDAIGAAEGVLRRLENNGVDVEASRAAVEEKNRNRGYYDVPETT